MRGATNPIQPGFAMERTGSRIFDTRVSDQNKKRELSFKSKKTFSLIHASNESPRNGLAG
jgi:hypothetical protein